MQREIMKTDPNEEITTATCVQTDASAVAAPVDFQEAMTEDIFDEDEGKTDDDGQTPGTRYFTWW